MRNNRSRWKKKESTPGRERNATHRNAEKLFTPPSSLRGGTAMGEVRREPGSAVGSEAGSLRRAARRCRLRSPRVPGRAGDPAQPGAPAGGKVPGRGTAGLSPPAQTQSNAATRGNTLRLSFHMVPLLRYLLAYTQGLFCPLKCSPLPTQRPFYIYSPPSHAAFNGRNRPRSPGMVQSPRF